MSRRGLCPAQESGQETGCVEQRCHLDRLATKQWPWRNPGPLLFRARREVGLVLHCCNKEFFLGNYPMTTSRSISSALHYRSLRSRLVALLLLVSQITSLLIVPLHAVAHAKGAYAPESVVAASSAGAAADLLSSLFGHERGSGCDDWSAAFSLDSAPAHTQADYVAWLPSATKVSGFLPFPSLPAPSPLFLARAPPRI